MPSPFDVDDVIDDEDDSAPGAAPLSFDVDDVAEDDGGEYVEPGRSDLDALSAHDKYGGQSGQALALLNGLLLGNGDDLADVSTKAGIPQWIAKHIPGAPKHEIDGMPAQYAPEQSDPDMRALFDLADSEHPIAKGAGTVAMGALASSIAPATAVLPQAAIGGGTGALAAGGETDWGDALSVLTGGAMGAGLGALGGLAGHGVSRLQKWMGSNPAVPEGVATTLPSRAEKWMQSAAPNPGKMPTATGLAMNAGKVAAVKGAQSLPPALFPAAANAATASGASFASKASAQDGGQAYANLPTMMWGVQAVLASGKSGLAPQEEQQLVEALMTGDKDKVIAANFKLQQRNPAYAKALQDELTSLNGEDRS